MRLDRGRRRRGARAVAGIVVLAGLAMGGGALGAVLGVVVLAAAVATRPPTGLALAQLAVGVTLDPVAAPPLVLAEAGVVGLLVAPPVGARWDRRTALASVLFAAGLAGLAVLGGGPLWVRAGAVLAAAVATGWVVGRADRVASADGPEIRERQGAEDVG